MTLLDGVLLFSTGLCNWCFFAYGDLGLGFENRFGEVFRFFFELCGEEDSF